jgi:hypothetical protein
VSELKQAKYELICGVVLTVTPLTAFAQRAVNAQAAILHPEPDRAPFEFEVEDALVPGTKTSAEQSREWLELFRGVLLQRQQAVVGLTIDAAVDVEDRDALYTPYARTMTHIRDAVKGTPAEAAMVSDFVSLLFGVLAEEQEVSALLKLAKGATPLTDAEINDGFRFFRGVDIPGPERIRRPRKAQSQAVQTSESRPDGPTHDGVRGGGVLLDASGPDAEPPGEQLVRTPAQGDARGEGSVLPAEVSG